MDSSLPIILLIEDDLPTAELYAQSMGDEFTVIICENHEQIIEKITDSEIAAVIMEPALLGGRGWAMIPNIVRELKSDSIPLILCSTVDDRKRGLEMGASAFLVKPVLPMTLLEVIRRVINDAKSVRRQRLENN